MLKTVFFDIDSQLDFLYPSGALYVPGAERILPSVSSLNRYAGERGIPVLSTTDAHLEDDPEFRQWPPHCIAGTIGQKKSPETLLDRRVFVPDCECRIDISGAQQVILEKKNVDVFAARNLPALLERFQANRYVVYGVVTEICVLSAARGLLRTGKPVAVVTDAIETLAAADSERALAEMRASGATLTTVSELIG